MENIVKTIINHAACGKESPPTTMKRKFRVRQYSTVQTVVEVESTGITAEVPDPDSPEPQTATEPQTLVEDFEAHGIRNFMAEYMEEAYKKSVAEAEQSYQHYQDCLDKLIEAATTTPANEMYLKAEVMLQAEIELLTKMVQEARKSSKADE